MLQKKLVKSFWGFLVERHLVKLGISKINALLRRQDCEYVFPQNFYDDANSVLQNVANLQSLDLNSLKQHMTEELAIECSNSIQNLHQNGKAFETRFAHPSLKIRGFDFSIGQYPIPEGYVEQTWLTSITYIIPKEDEKFKSHQKQQALVDTAHRYGCHVEIMCSLDCDFDLTIKDESTGLVLSRESYTKFDVSFISPHFTPYDDIFTLQTDGSCKLSWNWKISRFEKTI